jgi:SAM-dependent methyltransferase
VSIEVQDAQQTSGRQRFSADPRISLIAVSLLILYLELACIRWFPAHVLFLSFFTNGVLLACFLGMSLGCLIAAQSRHFILWTPIFLLVAMASAHGVEELREHGFPRGVQEALSWVSGGRLKLEAVDMTVGDAKSPQEVFFGTEEHKRDPAKFIIPTEVINGILFTLLALMMIGPGQELGRALNRVPNRIQAYSLNIFGSLLGIVLFAASSWLQLTPAWWFGLIVPLLGCFLFQHCYRREGGARLLEGAGHAVLLAGVWWLASWTSVGSASAEEPTERYWSPYYRVDYTPHNQTILVNLQGHQTMESRVDEGIKGTLATPYSLPHLLERDTGGRPFRDVLIIGAGSGNDVSYALQWGASHIDAVEIDPVIQRLGRLHHPDHPYADKRVTVHQDDGRNFLHSTDQKYDLIIYALVDSLVLHSTYSNIRLESYLFTRQAFEDVRRCLKPDGVFVMYNYFRQGWIVARLQQVLTEVFGKAPLLLSFPYQPVVGPESLAGYTMFAAHHIEPWQEAFRSHGWYWLTVPPAPSPASPNGFQPPEKAGKGWTFGLSGIMPPANLRSATDDWPFLYVRQPMIPDLSLRAMAIMAGISVVLLLLFRPRKPGQRPFSWNGRMFFLGAGFMLIETEAVVHMALLFGSTWTVNSIVFFAVLVMILLANLYVLACRPRKEWPYYVGLACMLGLNLALPLDFFLGMGRLTQVVGSCALVFGPILFAAVIFAISFGRSRRPDNDFGMNIGGAMLGGLAENASILLGFRYLMVVAAGFYGLSAIMNAGSASEEGHA